MSLTRINAIFYNKKMQGGFSLLEVLIALVIMSVGLLGLAKLQLNAIKFTYSSYTRTQALFLAYDVLEKMRANRTLALAGAYNTSFNVTASSSSCVSSTCTSAQMAAYDLAQWKSDLSSLLPSGDGAVAMINSGGLENIFSISVRWNDSRRNSEMDYKTFSLRSEL